MLGIEADCIVRIPDGEYTTEDVSATGIQTGNVPWGLDRIDQRTGRDGQYDWGNSNGAGVVVYVADTGVRISHDDFGGRVAAGCECAQPSNPLASTRIGRALDSPGRPRGAPLLGVCPGAP